MISHGPSVSIVMGVYNGQTTLRATVESILGQTFSAWEVIIVDDASTDETPQILEEFANKDPRIRVLRQPINGGLTCALIHGCNIAQGTYIARQDAGDISFDTRLEKQLAFLEEHPTVVAVGCGIRRVGPKGEFIGDTSRAMSPHEVTRVFLESGKAIVHAASMFRRSAYQTAGGYRDQFRVAQDIDLWYRLCEVGLLAEHSDVLASISIDLRGISASSNPAQHSLAAIARACHEARQSDNSECALLQQARGISENRSTAPKAEHIRKQQIREASYFLGSELYSHRNPKCRDYLLDSALGGHRILPSLTKYFLSFVACRAADDELPRDQKVLPQ